MPTAVCRTLHALSSKLHIAKNRIKFVQLAFQHSLVSEIVDYELWDKGYEGLGERSFDTCFEMGDAEDVIAALIVHARNNAYIDNVMRFCGEPSFAKWCSYADRQACLF
ncbi:hypothetical protein [Pseudomonas syringae]|uniref:hypothetical protein n=1 Tax=Pseudomonas syringae TaxID=317 RepID=UPI00259B76A8|nr:hypothetical protein [Pseudomonas syringae]